MFRHAKDGSCRLFSSGRNCDARWANKGGDMKLILEIYKTNIQFFYNVFFLFYLSIERGAYVQKIIFL